MGYIGKTIILTLIILVVIYIFIFRSIKKRKGQTFDTVQDYRYNYIDKNGIPKLNSPRYSNIDRSTIYSADSGSNNNKYVTRYNSSEDYRESNQFTQE